MKRLAYLERTLANGVSINSKAMTFRRGGALWVVLLAQAQAGGSTGGPYTTYALDHSLT